MLETLIASLLIGGFFAALPLWFLSTQDPWIHFSGGGNPWRCTVTRSHLLWRSSITYEPTKITVADRKVSFKYRTRAAWQLIFLQNEHRLEILASSTTNRRLNAIADELEKSRLAGDSVEQDLSPGLSFYVAIILVAVFAGAGAFIGWSGRSH